MSGSAQDLLGRARQAERRGELGAARALYAQVAQRFPGNARAREGLQRLAGAPDPDMPPEPEFGALVALYQQGRHGEALAGCEALLARFPRAFPLRMVHGVLLAGTGEAARAEAALYAALALRPGDADALCNLGNVVLAQGRAGEAAELFGAALASRPDHPEARANRGNALLALGHAEEAVAEYRRVLALVPDHVDVLYNLGNALRACDDHAGARDAYDRVLAIAPGHEAARWHRIDSLRQLCDWRWEADFAAIRAQVGGSAAALVSPFAVLGLDDDPAWQRRQAECFAAATFAGIAADPLPPHPPGPRLRIGYFSADFRDHATMALLAGVLRSHDRGRFEVHAYAYGPRDDPALLAQLATQLDGVHDVRGQSDEAIVAQARSHRLDIAVDLKGYTAEGRPALFAHRAAPVQLAWLGYPGPTGAPFIDYLVADAQVIPPAQRAHYGERILYLPHSYQPNDNARATLADPAPRGAHGLPEAGVVFASFNAAWKIDPAGWDAWMRLLRGVAGSVLWLIADGNETRANLLREAAARGVSPNRLVFAPRVPMAAHLARHVHADLFLDTFRCNAHTTASDALWMGLPVVTLAGRGFAARVGASLLHAAGLPDTIAADVPEYEALALALARDPARLHALKARLRAARTACPLFDTVRFTRALEHGFALVAERHREGLPPADIVVPEAP